MLYLSFLLFFFTKSAQNQPPTKICCISTIANHQTKAQVSCWLPLFEAAVDDDVVGLILEKTFDGGVRVHPHVKPVKPFHMHVDHQFRTISNLMTMIADRRNDDRHLHCDNKRYALIYLLFVVFVSKTFHRFDVSFSRCDLQCQAFENASNLNKLFDIYSPNHENVRSLDDDMLGHHDRIERHCI